MIRSLAMARDPLGSCRRLADEQGDVALFRLGRRRYALVSHPDLIHRVFVAGVREYPRPGAISSEGGFLRSADFDRHLQARRALAEAFSRARVNAASNELTGIAEQAVERWQGGERIEVLDEMMRLSVEMFFRAVVGSEPPRPAAELVPRLRLCFDTIQPAQSGVHALLGRGRVLKGARASSAFISLLGLMGDVIAERRRQGASGPDPISLLIHAAPDLDEGELAQELFALLFAASETTAATLAWTFYLLSRNQDVRQRLLEEIERGPEQELQPQMLSVLNETLRLYPVAWQLVREALADATLGDRTLRRGTEVWTVPFVVHRDERWWPEPDRFLPERWLNLDPTSAERPRLAFIPFGAGPRRCLGEAFAWRELAAIVGAVLPRWELTLAPGAEIRPHAGSTIYPAGGLRMRVGPRH